MYRVKYLLFCILFYQCSCVERKEVVSQNLNYVSINPSHSRSVNAEDIFASIELIALDNLDAALFNRCNKMQIFDDKYYILDKRGGCLLVFNEYGVFLKSSKHKQGNGPGEYYSIVDFDICENEYIEILDVSAYKIRRYDKNFNFINELIIPKELYPITTFKRLGDGLYAFYTPYSSFMGDNDKVRIFSFKNNQIIQSTLGYISTSSLTIHQTNAYSFYKLNEDVFFSFPYPNYETYKISENQINKVVQYDFGEFNFPFSTMEKNPTTFNSIMEGNHQYAFPTHRYENEKNIVTFISYKEELYMSFYEKNTGKTLIYLSTFNDNKKLLPPILVDKDIFYVVAEPDWLEFLVDENFLDEYSRRILKNTTTDDNYIIIKYALK